MSSTLQALRAESNAESAEKQRQTLKKKAILLLIHDYLVGNGYMETASKLLSEATNSLGKHEIADNIDLDIVLSEYESYYEIKFGKKPKLLRKLKDNETNPRLFTDSSTSSKRNQTQAKKHEIQSIQSDKLPLIPSATSDGPEADEPQCLSVHGSSFNQGHKQKSSNALNEKSLKPPLQFGGDSELKLLANSISKEIYQEGPNTRFDDIVGLDEAKRLLSESIQLPLKFPSIFSGILRPWRGILLHGPPGTGKTMLAKAVATECSTTFFNISASTLVSKWRGDSEKLVRVLFEMARYHAPSTIFLDEIDSILSSRGNEGNEHEASRRMKTELLIQMDGVKGSHGHPTDQVFVMAASNLPWDLDVAVLRRLEKRVLVGLPVSEARKAMILQHLTGRLSSEVNLDVMVNSTDGFSGADIELLCREAAMMPVRRLMVKVNELENDRSVSQETVRGRRVIGKTESVDVDSLIKSDPITNEDINSALSSTRPSSDRTMTKYIDWQSEYGSS